jgi:hypothetical protein
MSTATSKLTSKYQATIPEPVDLAVAQSLEGTLSEWASAVDEDAYREL